jgi:hypothetical protein
MLPDNESCREFFMFAPVLKRISFMKKNIILLGMSLLLIVLFFLVPCYHYVLRERLLVAFPQFMAQTKRMDVESRKRLRWDVPYFLAEVLQNEFERNHVKDYVLLLPPTEFFKKNGYKVEVPEPLVLYYYSGVRSVGITSDNVTSANFVAYPIKGKLKITRINSEQELERYINFFKS